MDNIAIANKGEMDSAAMTLIGASTKRDDENMIGMFGSGLKYALAVLIRNDIPLKIYSGTKEIKVITKKVKFRDKEFEQILIDGKETSLTTDMGAKWEPWFALREILCNAIDEGNHQIDVLDEVKPRKGYTTFFIGASQDMESVMANWQDYFCEKREDVVLSIDSSQVFHGSDQFIVYRRGIRCFHENKKCLYHYNMNWAEISESRVLESEYEFKKKLTEWWARHANRDMIDNLFVNFQDTYEGSIDWDWHGTTFNAEWLNAIDGRALIPQDIAGFFIEAMQREPHLILPSSLCLALSKFFRGKVKVWGKTEKKGVREPMTPDDHQKQILKDVLDFFKKSGMEITFPITIARFEKDYIMGEAADEQIFISPTAFRQGRRAVALTIIEEWQHLKSGAPDGSRRFQDWLINEFLFAKEQAVGTFL